MTWEDDMMERMTQAENDSKKAMYRCDSYERSILTSIGDMKSDMILFEITNAVIDCVTMLVVFWLVTV